MDCRELTDFIDAYLVGELAPTERETFAGHLAECPDCVKYLQTYQGSIALAKRATVETEAMPADLARAILAARRR